MAKKVLLINPDPIPRVLPPLGISYIAEILKANGHQPIMLDMGFDKTLNLDGIELVGITATTLIYFDAKSVVQQIKAINPNIPVVIGGTHASLLPDFVLNDSGCDAVVVGEGEQVMLQIANGELEPKGVINAPMISDIDSIPFLTYDYFDIQRYFKHSGADRIRWSLPQPSVAMIGTRGCPYACTFCASKSLFGRKVRFRSVANIMQEIDYLVSKYDIKSIYFYDDTLTLRKKWMQELCEELAKRKLQWICGTRVDSVNQEMLQMMKDSGCKYISYGIESGSNRVLKDIIKKGTTIEEAENILRLTRKVGIGIIANYMFGLPGETEEDLKLTLAAVKRLPADAAELSIFIPLPGTELATDLDWTKYDSTKNPYHQKSPIHTPEFAEIVKNYHRRAVRGFYFSPQYLLRQTKMLFYPKQLYFAFKSMVRLVRDIVKS